MKEEALVDIKNDVFNWRTFNTAARRARDILGRQWTLRTFKIGEMDNEYHLTIIFYFQYHGAPSSLGTAWVSCRMYDDGASEFKVFKPCDYAKQDFDYDTESAIIKE